MPDAVDPHAEIRSSHASEFPALSRITLASKEIAEVLDTSINSVDNHRRHIGEKLVLPNDVSSRFRLDTEPRSYRTG